MIQLKTVMGGEQRFVAVVFHGDAAAPDRLWVCVRGDQVPTGDAWSGCWSSAVPGSASLLQRLLENLNNKVVQGGHSGPFGPYLDEHYFFDGWDSWGSGIPSPIADLVPADVIADALPCNSVADLVARLFRADGLH